jgi:hypothetical protein
MEDELPFDIEKTLESLDHLKRAKAPMGFYEKLESRLQFANEVNKWFNLLKIGLAAMIVMSLLNGYMLIEDRSADMASVEDFTAEYFDTTASIIEY